jgi:hypothetical protein
MANERVSKALGEKFSFAITNTSGATKVIAILAAFFDTLSFVSPDDTFETAVIAYNNPAQIVSAGYACDAVLDDGTIADGVVATATSLKRSIRQFREYLKSNPRLCIDMVVQATIPAQFNQTVEVLKCNPLLGSLPQEINLNDFKSIDQFSTDKIEVRNLQLEMAYDTLMLLPVPTGCTTTISFKFS